MALETSGQCLAVSWASSPRMTLTSTKIILTEEVMASSSCACGRTVTVATRSWWLLLGTRIFVWISWRDKSSHILLLCSVLMPLLMYYVFGYCLVCLFAVFYVDISSLLLFSVSVRPSVRLLCILYYCTVF